jgi:hypothetical protein
MYKLIENNVTRNEYSTIPYTWIRSDKPNKSICIMLPGLGYSTQRPLFHYATGLFLNENIDVLHINYQFAKNEEFRLRSKTEQEQWMYDDVRAVVNEVLKDAVYEQQFIFSKSIGTIPMAMEWKQRNFIINETVGIWLTPLLKEDIVYEAILKTDFPSLSVIGDKDHHFIADRLAAFQDNSLIHNIMVSEADHGLEIQTDIPASIEVIKHIMESIKGFIGKHKIVS